VVTDFIKISAHAVRLHYTSRALTIHQLWASYDDPFFLSYGLYRLTAVIRRVIAYWPYNKRCVIYLILVRNKELKVIFLN